MGLLDQVDTGSGGAETSVHHPPIHKHVYVALPSASFSALRGPGLNGIVREGDSLSFVCRG